MMKKKFILSFYILLLGLISGLICGPICGQFNGEFRGKIDRIFIVNFVGDFYSRIIEHMPLKH